MFPDEDMLVEACTFDKKFDVCEEYEDAYVFINTRKRPGDYNPVVFYKADWNAVPFEMYKKTKLLETHDIKAAMKEAAW